MKRLFLFSAISTLPLWAAWQNPTPIYVGSGDQTIDMVISDGAGGAAVLWHDSQTGWEFMNVIDSAGNLKWGKQGVAVLMLGDTITQNPDMFLDSLGNYWVVLEAHWFTPSEGQDIYVQKISPTGQRLFGDKGVAVCTAEGTQDLTSICSSNGGAIVVWGDLRTSPSHSYTQRLGVNGQIKWTVNGIKLAEPDYSGAAKLVPDNHGGAFFIFRRWISSQNFISGQRLDTLGTRMWEDSGKLYVKGTMGSQFSYIQGHMTEDDSGGFVFFYDEGGYYRANRVDSLGNLQWDTSNVLLGRNHDNYNGSVSPLSPGGFFIVRGLAIGSLSEAVYVHRLTLNSGIPWPDTGVLIWNVWAYDPRSCFAPSVNENRTIVWRDVYDAGNPYGDRYIEQGIMAQRIDQNGSILWSKEILVCGASGSNPRTVSTYDEGSIVVWQDVRNASSDIYAAQVDSAGNVSGIEEQAPQTQPLHLQVQLIGSNPVDNSARVMFTIEKGAYIQANVYDASGRRVTILKSGYVSSGSHPLTWSGGDERGARCPSGVYFIRVAALGAAVTQKIVLTK